ncbi:MAG: hypothetical protein OES59_05860 [Gammaproteobacteria bacterium]|jgi:hypothetical protein|nr:hypothetical protein [Gammaproteobacteria bacterium]
MINKLFKVTLSTILAATLLVVVPLAHADRPETSSFGFAYPAVNPCTGEQHVLQIFIDLYNHNDHPNNQVSRIVRTGWSSDGYEMIAGGENLVSNSGETFHAPLWEIWRSEDGQMFTVLRRLVIVKGEVKSSTLESSCI